MGTAHGIKGWSRRSVPVAKYRNVFDSTPAGVTFILGLSPQVGEG
jgi:hypothetical protein